MSQEQQQTPQPDPISPPTSALPLPPVLVAALISGCTSDDVDRTDALSPSLDVNTEAATTSPSFLGVGKKRRARGLLKKAESKAEKKIRYQRNQNLQKRLNRILAKARIIYGATRGIRRFMLYKLLDAVDEMIEKNQFLLVQMSNHLNCRNCLPTSLSRSITFAKAISLFQEHCSIDSLLGISAMMTLKSSLWHFLRQKRRHLPPPRELTSWQKFVAMQQQTEDANDNLLRGAGKFAGASRLAMGWQSLTQEERDSFKDREIASKRKQKKRKVDDDETTIKSHHYNAVIKVFKTNINAMLQNFRSTHIILIAVTEDNIRETHLYPPVVLSNSDKDIPFPIIIKQCGVSD
ncbi:hypothetical protein G6F42_020595 [Rhizopus arrhizus]|nr:hypothetical protein G6F42_020595 [Rhizopus arrhizus]